MKMPKYAFFVDIYKQIGRMSVPLLAGLLIIYLGS